MEEICIRCTICCHYKFLREDGTVVYTDRPCEYLDVDTGLCAVYEFREAAKEDCVRITEEVVALNALPRGCPYVASRQGAGGAGRRFGGAVILPYLDKRPGVPASAWLAPTAAVIGDVTLGEETSVWFGAVVRGDEHFVRIGDRTNLQDGAVCHVTGGTHPLVVGDGVTVGHAAVLHGCTVRSNTLIGMAAVVLDGAEIGEGCLVAAGSLVTPGTRIPPGVLAVGRPARVRRELSAEERRAVREAARHYLDLVRAYRSGGA